MTLLTRLAVNCFISLLSSLTKLLLHLHFFHLIKNEFIQNESIDVVQHLILSTDKFSFITVPKMNTESLNSLYRKKGGRDASSNEWKKYELLFSQMSLNKSIIIIYIFSFYPRNIFYSSPFIFAFVCFLSPHCTSSSIKTSAKAS